MTPESNPRLVFERLFGSGGSEERKQSLAQRRAEKRSILDFVQEDARAMQKQLGRNDRDKLDECRRLAAETGESLDRVILQRDYLAEAALLRVYAQHLGFEYRETLEDIAVPPEFVQRIPVQFSKRVRGRKVMGGQSTYIPLKVNMAGVIPVIFATSIMYFPALIASVLPPEGWGATVRDWIDTNLLSASGGGFSPRTSKGRFSARPPP